MRFTQIIKFDVSLDRDRGMYGGESGYMGMSSGRGREGCATVRLEMLCSLDAVQWLQTAMGSGGPRDIQDLAQSIGLEQPGRRQPQARSFCVLTHPKHGTPCELYDNHRDAHTDSQGRSWPRSKVVEPEEVGTCRARHASGMGCVNLANTHTTHCSSKGWKWQDTAAAACGHKRGSYVCVEPQGHDGNHTGGAGTSWPWTLPVVPRCGRCGAQAVVRVNRKKGTEFTACVEWPTCDWTYGRPPPQVVRCTAKQRVTDLQCAREVGHEGTHVTMGAPFGAEADAAAAAAPGYARRELELGDD